MKKRKILGILLLAVAAAVCLGMFVFGINRRDSLKPVEVGVEMGNQVRADFEVRLGKKVGGMTLTAELWQNGVCETSEPFFVDSQAKKLAVTAFVNRSDREEEPGWLDIQMDTDTDVWGMNAHFEPTAKWVGYAFKSLKKEEELLALPGEEAVLAAIAFDMGAGVRSLDCRAYVEEPERLSNADCLIIVRATFSGK